MTRKGWTEISHDQTFLVLAFALLVLGESAVLPLARAEVCVEARTCGIRRRRGPPLLLRHRHTRRRGWLRGRGARQRPGVSPLLLLLLLLALGVLNLCTHVGVFFGL